MNNSTNGIDGLSHGVNEASLSDAAPKSNFCSTCVKALHHGNLPAAGCSADGDDLDQEHRSIGAADVLAPIIQKHARALYEELCKKAMSPATLSVTMAQPSRRVPTLRKDLAVLHRKRLDSALLKTAPKAKNGCIPFTSGDHPRGRIYRLDDIEIKVIVRNDAVALPWFRL
ncbi:hypothetical protein ACQRIT_006688 [Beauveria bassiana]